MEEKNIKITINVECSEKSSVKKEQIAGYLLRAVAGVTANNKCLITNYVCEINEKMMISYGRNILQENLNLQKTKRVSLTDWILRGVAC